MAQASGGGGGGGGGSAYGSGGSVYGSQVPKAAAKSSGSKKKPAAYKKGGSVYSSQVPKSSNKSSGGSHKSSGGGGHNSGGGGNNGGSSTRGGYSGGGGLGSSSTGAIVPKAPVVPSMKDYLKTDSTYQGQQAALQKALADYKAQQNVAKTGYETNYAADTAAWGNNRKSSMADLENDYASRGLLQSGLYADAMTNTGNEWDSKKSALDLARQQYTQGLTDQLTNFTTQQTLTGTQAQQEAAARRAAKYGIS